MPVKYKSKADKQYDKFLKELNAAASPILNKFFKRKDFLFTGMMVNSSVNQCEISVTFNSYNQPQH